MRDVFTADLVNEEYVFGRGECCDYCFDEKGGRQNQHFPAFSKTHFRLYRVGLTSSQHTCRPNLHTWHGTFIEIGEQGL